MDTFWKHTTPGYLIGYGIGGAMAIWRGWDDILGPVIATVISFAIYGIGVAIFYAGRRSVNP